MYSLGAVDSVTNEYTQPADADAAKNYKCMECDQRVIPRKGQIRRPHFAHYAPTNTCTYYEHPNESQLHKDSKYKLAEWLSNCRPITLFWMCIKCESGGGIPGAMSGGEIIVKYEDGDESVVEYRDPNGKYVADVALLNNGNIRYIFEVKHTHATTTTVRPDPWFEISTGEIQEITAEDNNVMLECIRQNRAISPDCYGCNKRHANAYIGEKYINGKKHADYITHLNEPWLRNMPRLLHKVGNPTWKQVSPCIKCGRDGYNPVFVPGNGYLQICKICISDHEDTLKTEYHTPKCLFIGRRKKN
jgi:hypothetical protein